ncbi:MAG: site-specific DNA-methyltransferase [Anaerolineae bacterium]
MKRNLKHLMIQGHVLDALDTLKPKSIQTVVTSPPYWGMRRYKRGVKQQWADGLTAPFGAEPTPEQYVWRTVKVLKKLHRVLKDNGVVWWNLGDTYFTRAIIRESSSQRLDAFEGRRKDTWATARFKRTSSGHEYLKDKDLTLIPFLVAIEAQKLGFWVRSIIIWEKENIVPEPRLDRPVVSHEYVLMLTKSKAYRWHSHVAMEKGTSDENIDRQLRSVWTMSTSNGRNDHPAMFPEELATKCILLTTNKGDTVLDPFFGSGTTGSVADRVGRRFIGIDVVKSYLRTAQESLSEQHKQIAIEWRDCKSKPRKKKKRTSA